MKGRVDPQPELFFTLRLEKKVPEDDPLRISHLVPSG